MSWFLGMFDDSTQQGAGPAPPSDTKMLIQFSITAAGGATQSSVTSIPAGALVLRSGVHVTTPFSPGTTIAVGQTGSASLLQATGDNLPTIADLHNKPNDVAWGGSALPVLATVGGSPAAGAADIIVEYVPASSINP